VTVRRHLETFDLVVVVNRRLVSFRFSFRFRLRLGDGVTGRQGSGRGRTRSWWCHSGHPSYRSLSGFAHAREVNHDLGDKILLLDFLLKVDSLRWTLRFRFSAFSIPHSEDDAGAYQNTAYDSSNDSSEGVLR
jgi:hypothetical protein